LDAVAASPLTELPADGKIIFSGMAQQFSGWMDEVRLYTRALRAEEAAALYAEFAPNAAEKAGK
jgi:hypothetical protein